MPAHAPGVGQRDPLLLDRHRMQVQEEVGEHHHDAIRHRSTHGGRCSSRPANCECIADRHEVVGCRLPLRITGTHLNAIEYKMPVVSAQVKSALLFAGLLAEGETRVEEPVRTRDHGELALRAFGAEVTQHGNQARIAGGQKLHAIEAEIPGDLSTAAFFLCAAALFPGSRLLISHLLMNPTRARLLDILILMGVGISVAELEDQHGELAGTVEVDGRDLRGRKDRGRRYCRP